MEPRPYIKKQEVNRESTQVEHHVPLRSSPTACLMVEPRPTVRLEVRNHDSNKAPRGKGLRLTATSIAFLIPSPTEPCGLVPSSEIRLESWGTLMIESAAWEGLSGRQIGLHLSSCLEGLLRMEDHLFCCRSDILMSQVAWVSGCAWILDALMGYISLPLQDSPGFGLLLILKPALGNFATSTSNSVHRARRQSVSLLFNPACCIHRQYICS